MPASVVQGRATRALPMTHSVAAMKTSGTTGYPGVRYGRGSRLLSAEHEHAGDGECEEGPDTEG